MLTTVSEWTNSLFSIALFLGAFALAMNFVL